MPRHRFPGPIALTLLVLVSSGVSRAQEAALTVPEAAPYSVRFWNTANGLAQNSVNDVLQTRDGMVWVATFGGLSRFDGHEWISYDSATAEGFPDNRITSMYEARDGALWFGSAGGVLTRLRDGEFTRVAEFAKHGVNDLCAGWDGEILVAIDQVLYSCLADGRAERIVEDVGYVNRLVGLPSGQVLAATQRGAYLIDQDGPVQVVSVACSDASVAPDGTAYVGSRAGLYRSRADEFDLVAGTGGYAVTAVHHAGDGSLWAATRSGLHRVPADGDAEVSFQLGSIIRSIVDDSNGGMWLGFSGGGLARLRTSEVRVCQSDPRDPDTLPVSVIGGGPGRWFVGSKKGLSEYRFGKAHAVESLRGRSVFGLMREADGTLWVGLEDSIAALRDGDLTEVSAPAGLRLGAVRAICRDAKGRLWAGGAVGAVVLEDGVLHRQAAAAAAGRLVKLLRLDADGDLWLAGDIGLVRLSANGELKRCWEYGRDLPEVEVRAILPRPDGCTWLGTYGSGFIGLDGDRVHLVGPNEGLLDAFVCTVSQSDHGWVVGSNRGAFLIDPAGLDRIAAGEASHIMFRPLIGPSDISLEANGGVEPSSWTQGNMTAMCSFGGINFIDSSRLGRSLAPPIVQVEPICSGDQRSSRLDGAISMAATVDRTFVVRCTAPDFDHPELMRYRWRLAPDGAWSPLSRERTISFSVPGVGDYLFEVEAVSVDDRVSEAPAQVSVHVAPLFWERSRWVGAVVAAVIALGIWLSFRFGRRRSARRAHELQVLVDEQTGELRHAHETLEQRVVDRTAELEKALQQIEADHIDRAQLEREVHELQRMESLGQLAGSVAHDFNNLLTIVLGNAYLLEAETTDHAELAEHAVRIREAGERGRSLTQHLLAVASQQTVNPSALDLVEHLQAEKGVLQELLGAEVELELVAPGEPVHVKAAPSQIDQILMNLCINARDAMPSGGTVVVSLESSGSQALVRVADTGGGMSEDVQKRLFEPFFTTKSASGGTGLGLATVYGIIKQLKGEISVESSPEEGTRFTLILPLTERPLEPVVEIPAPERGPAALRVILVEDEPAVRRALRMMLESAECQIVVEAENGADAIRKLDEFAGQIDVVLSDVRMPGLQGVDLVEAIRERHPSVPVVFLSGYTSSPDALAALQSRGVELVAKPPDPEQLLAVLRRARQQAAGAG